VSSALLRTPSLGDLPIVTGSMRLRLQGVWQAVAEVSTATTLADLSPASIVLTREDQTEDVFVGAVRKSELNDGTATLSVTVVGGMGLLASTVPARDHDQGATELPLGLVVEGIVGDTGNPGEQLAAGVAAALDVLTVPHWHRVEGPADEALDLLAELLGISWRVLPDGTVWAALAEPWPAAPAYRRLTYFLEDGGALYAPDGGQILPGQVLEGRQLVDVVYRLGGPLRAEVRGTVEGDPPVEPDQRLYARSWDATVVTQDATTGLLEVTCDDARLGSLRGVPLRVGIPGALVTLDLTAIQRLRVAFGDADPRYPFACAHDQDPTATAPVALVGDTVAYLSATATVTALGQPGPVMFTASTAPTFAVGETQLTISGPGSAQVRLR
jgi:hypothetical protein